MKGMACFATIRRHLHTIREQPAVRIPGVFTSGNSQKSVNIRRREFPG